MDQERGKEEVIVGRERGNEEVRGSRVRKRGGECSKSEGKRRSVVQERGFEEERRGKSEEMRRSVEQERGNEEESRGKSEETRR